MATEASMKDAAVVLTMTTTAAILTSLVPTLRLRPAVTPKSVATVSTNALVSDVVLFLCQWLLSTDTAGCRELHLRRRSY